MDKRLKKLVVIICLGLLAYWGYGEIRYRLPNFLGGSPYTSKYVYVYNRTTAEEELNINSRKQTPPASLVKMMSTLVALEHVSSLDEVAPIDVPTYQAMVEADSSMAGFYGMEPVTYRDLLYGTILASGGECANTLAIHLAGSREEFVRWMNDKATELGMTDTYYMNPEGLDHPLQMTTARDQAILLNHALDDGDFRAIFTTPSYHSTPTADHPTGILIDSTVMSLVGDQSAYDFKILGGKSGTTEDAGLCWATLTEKNGQEYLVIVMGVEDLESDDQLKDTLKIMEEL